VARRSRGRWLAIFAGLAVLTIVFIVIAISAHTTPCKGLSCPSGGGAAQAPSGTSVWTAVGDIGGALSGVGALLSGLAAFRKDKRAPARAGNPGGG
jgi:hypothetical protein